MRGYLRALGPGLVTGTSDDDPSGIATYAQAGSRFGFGFLWTVILTFPLMAAVQERRARSGSLVRSRLPVDEEALERTEQPLRASRDVR